MPRGYYKPAASSVAMDTFKIQGQVQYRSILLFRCFPL